MRIAIGGIRHETNTFSALFTDLEHFNVYRGDALLKNRLDGNLFQEDIELIPAFIAEALPGGLVRQGAYLKLKNELLQEFSAALPVDGVYLDLHGAMEVEGIGDGEGDLSSAVRDLVGNEVLVSVSLDLHGNISPELVRNVDILTAFRTAPHRDYPETCRRALGMLVRALQDGIRPVSFLMKLPLLLSGEQAVTDVEPARSLYALLPEVSSQAGVMDASFLVGCAWTDSPFTPASVIVVAEKDHELAQRYASWLAGEIWAKRGDFRFHVQSLPVDDAIRAALNSTSQPVFLTDSGDNVTAGAGGDSPYLLERMLALQAESVLIAGIADAGAVQACHRAGVGADVDLSIGGKLEVLFKPLDIRAKVMDLFPDSVVVRLAGITLVLTAERRPFIDRAGFSQLKLDPRAYHLVVVKQGYLFPELVEMAGLVVMALSPGSTDLRLEQLSYHKIPRPVYPLDPEMTWAP